MRAPDGTATVAQVMIVSLVGSDGGTVAGSLWLLVPTWLGGVALVWAAAGGRAADLRLVGVALLMGPAIAAAASLVHARYLVVALGRTHSGEALAAVDALAAAYRAHHGMMIALLVLVGLVLGARGMIAVRGSGGARCAPRRRRSRARPR